MKAIITLLLILWFAPLTNAQTPCTLILKNRSVIEVYHIGNLTPCKKKKKDNTIITQDIIIQGLKDDTITTINDFANIKEIKFNRYQSTEYKNGKYCLDLTIIYKNGEEVDLTKACIKCTYDENSLTTTLIPIHTGRNELELNKREIDIRSIDTLIF